MRDSLDIIVIDDGSNEYDAAMNATVAIQNSAKYIKLEENSGSVSIPRNIGISWASGEYIAPTDDDCLPKSKKFSSLLTLMTDPSVILAFGNRDEFVLQNSSFEFVRTVSCGGYVNNPKEVGIDNGQFIYRTSVYNSIKPVIAINACDWELYSRISDLGKFAHTNQSVCKYLWHANNISRIPKPNRVDPIKILPKYLKYFKEGPYKDACQSLLNT